MGGRVKIMDYDYGGRGGLFKKRANFKNKLLLECQLQLFKHNLYYQSVDNILKLNPALY